MIQWSGIWIFGALRWIGWTSALSSLNLFKSHATFPGAKCRYVGPHDKQEPQEAVKPLDDLCGRITLNSVPSFPSKPQRTRQGELGGWTAGWKRVLSCFFLKVGCPRLQNKWLERTKSVAPNWQPDVCWFFWHWTSIGSVVFAERRVPSTKFAEKLHKLMHY